MSSQSMLQEQFLIPESSSLVIISTQMESSPKKYFISNYFENDIYLSELLVSVKLQGGIISVPFRESTKIGWTHLQSSTIDEWTQNR